jgi:hypothetical protein
MVAIWLYILLPKINPEIPTGILTALGIVIITGWYVALPIALLYEVINYRRKK